MNTRTTNIPPISPNTLGVANNTEQRQAPIPQLIPPATPSSGASDESEALEKNLIVLSAEQLNQLIEQATVKGVEIAFKKIENEKRHLLFKKFRMNHREASEYLSVTTRTLNRKRDEWALDFQKDGKRVYYSMKSLEKFKQNRG